MKDRTQIDNDPYTRWKKVLQTKRYKTKRRKKGREQQKMVKKNAK